MNNIIVRDTAALARWEFIRTPDPQGSSLRLHNYWDRTGHWALTAEPHMRRPEGDYETKGVRVPQGEEPNSIERPTVPNHIIEKALDRAGAGAVYKAWPSEGHSATSDADSIRREGDYA